MRLTGCLSRQQKKLAQAWIHWCNEFDRTLALDEYRRRQIAVCRVVGENAKLAILDLIAEELKKPGADESLLWEMKDRLFAVVHRQLEHHENVIAEWWNEQQRASRYIRSQGKLAIIFPDIVSAEYDELDDEHFRSIASDPIGDLKRRLRS